MTVRSILITGCSSGIGLDAARTLRARGWRVFATCRQEVDCDRLRGEGLESFRLDYADEASIADAVTEVVARTGGTLDALYNNGAFACPGAVEDLPRGALREIFEVNLFGYHDLSRIYQTEDLAPGEQILLSCSGVTDGELLHGVRFFGGGSRTHTLFMSLSRKMIRFVDTIHREDLSTPAYFDV